MLKFHTLIASLLFLIIPFYSFSQSANEQYQIGNTCETAFEVFNKDSFIVRDVRNGLGSSSQSEAPSCFGLNRTQSVFVKFTVVQTGTLEFTISSLDSSLLDSPGNQKASEFDWGLYELNNCSESGLSEVCCNFNSTALTSEYQTGMDPSGVAYCESNNSSIDNFSNPILLNEGQTYLLLIDRDTSGFAGTPGNTENGGFSITWGGGFELIETIAPSFGELTINGSDTSFCENKEDSISLFAISDSVQNSFVWFADSNELDTLSFSDSLKLLVRNDTTVYVRGFRDSIISELISKQITFGLCEFGELLISGNDTACLMDSIALYATSDSANDSFVWFSDSMMNDTLSTSDSIKIEVLSDTILYIQAKRPGFKTKFISKEIVLAPSAPIACFSYCGIDELLYQFYDLSKNANFWQWDFGTRGPLVYDQNPTNGFAQSGTFRICFISGNSCGRDTLKVDIKVKENTTTECDTPKIVTSVYEQNNQVFVYAKVYPVPAKNTLSVDFKTFIHIESIRIFGIQGNLLKKINSNFNGDYLEIDISNLKKGTYLIEFNSGISINRELFYKQY
jgi:hypothetical protein